MKNLKKLMSVILTVAMLMSMIVSTSAVTFTDVDETSAAYEAIEVLSALEILSGREDGTFDPDANIKRSEFAAVICRTMNAEAAASGSVANFTDVAANHWAAGYIGWAAGSGIVNGKGDGKFDPDANVTYQEAVTMIVRAMGFEPLATKRGGFPTGYMAIANTYGITNGVAMSPANAAADRKGVAQLVYNSFDAPLMDASFITLSDEDEYQIYEGKSYSTGSYDERRTLLSQYKDIYKVKAIVANTYKSAANAALIKGNGDKQVELTLVNNGLYKFPAGQIQNEFGFTNNQITAIDNVLALCNDSSVADYFGYTVNAYITYNNDGETEVVAMVPDMKSIETKAFAAPKTEISKIDTEAATGGDVTVFEYWENDKVKDAKMAKAADTAIYVNGIADGTVASWKAASDRDLADLYDGTYSSITLLGSKSTGTFSKILATKYDYAMVESVDTELMTIACTNGAEYSLNPDDLLDEFDYAIYKDGVAITLADIAEGDILNIISDDAGNDEGSFENDYFADIYVSNEVIESSVSQYNPSTDEYTIDGVEYLLATGAEISSMNAGDAGLFYLTIDGYVYDAELTKGFSGNYAFVLDMALDASSFGETWQIKMLTKDNSVVTYNVKNNAKIEGAAAKNDKCNGIEGACDTDSATAGNQPCDQCAALATLYNAVKVAPTTSNANARLISYNLSGDEISVIDYAALNGGDREYNYRTLPTTATYNASTERLGGFNLLTGTVVFNAPFEADGSLDENKVQVYTISSLDEDIADYNGFVFDVDKEKAIGAALITNNMGFAGKANALAVVKSVSTGLDAAGNSADIVNFFQAGEMKSLPVTNDAYLNASYSAINMSAGDIFQYTTNAAGEINNMVEIFDMEETYTNTADPSQNTVAYNGGVVKNSANTVGTVSYSVGVVTDIASKSLDLANGASFGWDLAANGTNVLFDVAKASANLNNAFDAKTSTSYIKAAKIADSKYSTDVYVVVVKADDGVATEVVAYKYAKADNRVAATFDALFTIA